MWRGAQKHGMRGRDREGGRVRGALVTLESPGNGKISSEAPLSHGTSRCRRRIPTRPSDAAARLRPSLCFPAAASLIGSTTILDDSEKSKSICEVNHFCFSRFLRLQLMFAIVPVKSLQRPITSVLVEKGMSPHLCKQSQAFLFLSA